MAILEIVDHSIEIDLVVFDKDGTLIDLHRLWGGRTRRCAAWLAERAGLGESLPEALYRALGYDPASARLLADGPMATIPRNQLVLVTATVLYQHGLGWHHAHELAEQSFAEIMTALPARGDLDPIGDLVALFYQLRAADVRIAVATSDDRRPTEHTLRLLEVHEQVDWLVCGDDPLPAKPAPEVLAHLAGAAGVAPARILMVGDTGCDMQTGRNGGAGLCLGVLTGAADAEALAGHADRVVDSVQAIRVRA
jgi:phosphoglycolate phosphatase